MYSKVQEGVMLFAVIRNVHGHGRKQRKYRTLRQISGWMRTRKFVEVLP